MTQQHLTCKILQYSLSPTLSLFFSAVELAYVESVLDPSATRHTTSTVLFATALLICPVSAGDETMVKWSSKTQTFPGSTYISLQY